MQAVHSLGSLWGVFTNWKDQCQQLFQFLMFYSVWITNSMHLNKYIQNLFHFTCCLAWIVCLLVQLWRNYGNITFYFEIFSSLSVNALNWYNIKIVYCWTQSTKLLFSFVIRLSACAVCRYLIRWIGQDNGQSASDWTRVHSLSWSHQWRAPCGRDSWSSSWYIKTFGISYAQY